MSKGPQGMRIFNERTLTTLPSRFKADMEGYLYKRGVEYNNSFKRRYFMLISNLLYYFDKAGDREPLGIVVLEGHLVSLFEDSTRPHAFTLRFPDDAMRQYVLAADSSAESNKWMRALLAAGVDYTRLTLEELETQFQRDSFEIPELPEVTPLRSPCPGGAQAGPRINPFNDPALQFRVTAHFPTFTHFHAAIEQALCLRQDRGELTKNPTSNEWSHPKPPAAASDVRAPKDLISL